MSITEIPPITSSWDDGFPLKWKWTRDEYRLLSESRILPQDYHYELIAGEIFRKVGQNEPHVFTCILAFDALRDAFGKHRVRMPGPVAIDDNNEPEPDVAVTKHPLRHYLSQGTPTAADVLLAVEVSDSTLRFDRSVKALLYARAGIPEYWIVDIAGRQLLVYRQPGPNGYADQQTLSDAESVSPIAAPAASLRIADLLP